MRKALGGALGAALLAVLPLSAAKADSVADFYKGKNITLYIGYSVGGGYDTYARLLATYMSKYIPGNPTVVPKNMTGAGSLVLANYLYQVAPKDGTAFGEIGRGIPFDPLFGLKRAKFDASKFTWIGSMNDEVSVCVSWEGSGVKTIDDVMKKELVVGGTGASADTDEFPKILNGVLGTKFKLVTGYPGGNEVGLAMERGEVKGRCGWSWSSVKSLHLDWVKSGKVRVLIQLALKKHPDLPNVPLVMDLAKTPEQKQMLKLVFVRQSMGRPFLAPPGVPADRAAALRKAFDATMKDKDFLAVAAKQNLEMNPVSGQELQDLVEEAYKAPKALAQRVATLLDVALMEKEAAQKKHKKKK
jgi:tripartite-type tricarboxylate transporter receptor subunit TctC